MAIVALILTILKIFLDIFIYFVKRQTQEEIDNIDSEGKKCQYLKKKENEVICTHYLFKKGMVNGICPRQQCSGFDTGEHGTTDSEIINSPIFLLIKKIVDLFPEFAAAILAINEILN